MNEYRLALLNKKQYKFSSIPNKDSIFGDIMTSDAQTGNLIFSIKEFSKLNTLICNFESRLLYFYSYFYCFGLPYYNLLIIFKIKFL